MAIHGYTWHFMAIHGYTWLYMTIHGNTWQYMVIHGNTWQYMVIHGYTWQYMVIHGYTWQYLVPREARFIISSRAKRACITQAFQGQRDFLLTINLSSLVGVRLDVIQLVTYEGIMGFQATDCHRRQSFEFYS